MASVYVSKSELGHLATPSCKRDWSVPAFFVSEVEVGHGEGVGNAQRISAVSVRGSLAGREALIGLVSCLLVSNASGRAFTWAS